MLGGINKEKVVTAAGVAAGFAGANYLVRPLVSNLTTDARLNALAVGVVGVLVMGMSGKMGHIVGAGIAANGALALFNTFQTATA